MRALLKSGGRTEGHPGGSRGQWAGAAFTAESLPTVQRAELGWGERIRTSNPSLSAVRPNSESGESSLNAREVNAEYVNAVGLLCSLERH
jgi:hypothetical protein